MAANSVTKAWDAKLSKQRLDFTETPDGRVAATLTVTLPGGVQKRFTAYVSAKEAREVSGDVSYAALRAHGYSDDEISGLFGDIFKGVKKIAKGAVKVVKTVATSKVFKLAAKGLAVVAPALGPLAPAALAVSGGMMATSALVGARAKAARGDKKGAAIATAAAVKLAQRVAPKNHKQLIAWANVKSKNAIRVASKPPKAKKVSTAQALRSLPSFATPRKLAADTTRSSAKVTPLALVKAARAGRVYVVAPKAS
jgi:hypothetical protein